MGETLVRFTSSADFHLTVTLQGVGGNDDDGVGPNDYVVAYCRRHMASRQNLWEQKINKVYYNSIPVPTSYPKKQRKPVTCFIHAHYFLWIVFIIYWKQRKVPKSHTSEVVQRLTVPVLLWLRYWQTSSNIGFLWPSHTSRSKVRLWPN